MTDTVRAITLKCASCGAALEISPDMNQFACGYCGTEQVVERRGGTVSLKLVADAITKVQAGTDKTAAELALKRLDEELRQVILRQIIVQEQSEKKTNKMIVRLLIVFVVILTISITAGNNSVPIGIVLFLGGAVALFFLGKAMQSDINQKTDEQFKPVLEQRKSIEEKIARNKSIVDS